MNTATARPPYSPPVRRVAFGTIEPQGHRVGLYGPGGIGKTTLAMTAPGPVGVIDLDDSLPILKPSLGELDTHDNVEGVDITVPVYTWSETHYLPDASVNKAAYYALTGKTNNAAFKGCAAGECLFLGASGSKRGSDDWEITFKFAASPNRTGITVGGITGITKKGWEYMWVRYADAEDATAKAIVKKPVAVYIEKVYEEGNLGNLGIGT